jgi:hypothetical protein
MLPVGKEVDIVNYDGMVSFLCLCVHVGSVNDIAWSAVLHLELVVVLNAFYV